MTGAFAIAIAIYYKINEDKRAILAYAANSALFCGLLYNKSSRFFVPQWFKRSLTGYMGFLTFLGLFSLIAKNSQTESKNIDDTIQRVHYRYIKELASI